MNRRSFIQSLAGACLGPFIKTNRSNKLAPCKPLQHLSGDPVEYPCIIGIGNYGRSALEALSKTQYGLYLFEFTGTSNRDLAISLRDSGMAFICANPTEIEEVREIERLSLISRAYKTFSVCLCPNLSLFKGEVSEISFLSSYIALPEATRENILRENTLLAVTGFFNPLFSLESPIPYFNIGHLIHVAGAKLGTFRFGTSNYSLSDAFTEAIRNPAETFNEANKYALLSVLSTNIDDVLIASEHIAGYGSYFDDEQDLLWGWSKTSMLGHKYTVVLYLFEGTNS